METYAILGDLQVPYHDPSAVEVALQIIEETDLHGLVLNGDFGDFRTIALKFPVEHNVNVIAEMREEMEVQCTLLKAITRRATRKGKRTLRKQFNGGNHEWRVQRALSTHPAVLQLLGIDTIRNAVSISSLLGLNELGYEYTDYPNGCWLKKGLRAEDNFWAEHGYAVRKNAGYLATSLVQDRMTNVIVGHVERMAVVYKKVLGNRIFAGIEGGTLSRIAQPGKGEGIYSGVPHSVPDYMNHTQGFVLINYHNGHWFPELVPIFNGEAVFRGRIFKA